MKNSYIFLILLTFLTTACHRTPPQIPSNTPEEDTVGMNLIEYNKLCQEDERREIEAYIDSVGGFTKSDENYYYRIKGQGSRDKESLSTSRHPERSEGSHNISAINFGDRVSVAYSIELLDGTVCYQSTDGKALTFTVGKRQVIKGLDIAIVGHGIDDEIDFIFPYNMAYGIIGDRECITPMTPVLYRIKVISVK